MTEIWPHCLNPEEVTWMDPWPRWGSRYGSVQHDFRRIEPSFRPPAKPPEDTPNSDKD